jgi:putative membrane protein
MRFPKSSSLAFVFVASVVGAACGSSNQQTPPNTQAGAATNGDAYGSTMNQPTSPADQPTTAAPTGGQGPGRTMESANGSGSISESNPGSATSAANLEGQLGSPPADTVGTTPTTTTPTAGAPADDGSGSTADVSHFHDADVAAVLRTVNQGELDEAQLALAKSKSADVRRFAQHMATDHREMLTKDKALLSRIHVTPSDNVVSQQLKTDGRQELTTLQGDTGRDFDRAYMDAQVKGHHHALALIDEMLPSVENGDYKTAIQGARGKVEHHLQEAERIQQAVEQGSANKQNGM